MSALLQLTDVRRNFGGVHAVDGVSLEIEEGTIFGLIGPNGAGKTTLVNLVTGYIRSQSGSIRMTSRSGPAELARRPPHAIAGLGIARTFQTLRLYRNLRRPRTSWSACIPVGATTRYGKCSRCDR